MRFDDTKNHISTKIKIGFPSLNTQKLIDKIYLYMAKCNALYICREFLTTQFISFFKNNFAINNHEEALNLKLRKV